ncbi:MAG: hypothetical protein IT221_16800 [Fluviicola sp.]|nr:hypothetical protein [Fluviicola sp.]
MTTDKLYKLMDILDDLKQIDQIISLHRSENQKNDSLMLSQYLSRRNQLLVYFINELNVSTEQDFTPQRLSIIKQIMERFYQVSSEDEKHDAHLDSLVAALSA